MGGSTWSSRCLFCKPRIPPQSSLTRSHQCTSRCIPLSSQSIQIQDMEHVPIPTPSQVALAMAIVKHKPADEGIKEYILRIRQHIKSSKENNHSYPQEKFFDSVSFWQNAYEKSEAEQSKLLDRIFELERRNEALVAKLQNQGTDVGTREQSSSKRRTSTGKNPTAARKRAKTQVNTGGVRVLEYNYAVGDSAGAQHEYLEESTGPFMRQFYALQKALQKRSNDGEIARYAVILCQTVSNKMSNLTTQLAGDHSKKTPLQAKQPDISAVLHMVDRAFRLLCQALKKLLGSTSEIGIVIYHMVGLYESTLNALQQECKAKADQETSSTKAKGRASKSKQTTKSKGVALNPSPGTQLSPHSELATQITRFLNSMVISLDVACAAHQNLLEGFLILLLGRVGKLLSLFVFQDLQTQSDLRVDSGKLPTPAGLYGFDTDHQSQCAERMEARHLIWLLERMLAMVDTLRSPSSTSVPQEPGTSIMSTSKIKDQLQSTLLQSVFGESSEWRNALQPLTQPDPKDLDELLSDTQIPERTTPDWFIQEVWRLLGWDMLQRKSVQDK